MHDILAGWFRWIEAGSWSTAIKQSLWIYPFLEIIHITGITMVAGAAILFDLRLLNIAFRLPVSDIARYLLPWSRRGLFLVIPSGLLLFITNAEALAFQTVFQLKLFLLFAAGVNAFMFHLKIYRPKLKGNPGADIPAFARLNAVLSIALWISIISCGRLLAYL